jgi:hypothetical protein
VVFIQMRPARVKDDGGVVREIPGFFAERAATIVNGNGFEPDFQAITPC